jgi:hypothetical protein
MTTTTLKHLLAALLFAATFGQAQALTLTIGDLLTEGPVTLSRVFAADRSFIDVFNFSLSAPAVVSFDWGSTGIGGLKLGAPEGVSVLGAGSLLVTDALPAGAYSASLAGTASAGDTYEMSLSAVVPEPAAWMLFLAGFALLGVIVRTRLR